MKALWLSRHEPTEEQVEVLTKKFHHRFDETNIKQVDESLPSNSRESVVRFDELADDCNIAIVVLPINLLEAILKFSNFYKSGGMILRAVMNREIIDDNVVFSFSHYEKVIKVEVVTEVL
jgi:hypothetical protein